MGNDPKKGMLLNRNSPLNKTKIITRVIYDTKWSLKGYVEVQIEFVDKVCPTKGTWSNKEYRYATCLQASCHFCIPYQVVRVYYAQSNLIYKSVIIIYKGWAKRCRGRGERNQEL